MRFLLSILICGAAFADETTLRKRPLPLAVKGAADALKSEAILKHVKELTRQKYEGREAGEPGARLASEYIARQFSSIGLVRGGTAGTFFQTFKIRAGHRITSELAVEHPKATIKLSRRGHYMPVHLPENKADVKSGLVLAGYGISAPNLAFDEYAELDVKDKAVLVFGGVPWSPETAAWLRRIEKADRYTLAYKARCAAERGASLLIVVNDPSSRLLAFGAEEELRLPDTSFPLESKIPVLHVTREAAALLTRMTDGELKEIAARIRLRRRPESHAIKSCTITLKARIDGNATLGRNVIGVLLGSDRVLRKEAIVIGAHYDHLGENAFGTYFGANDNAAGVGVVIELAAAFKRLPIAPRRSIVFVAFSAEEIGKLGSGHYVNSPPIPIKQTVAMINFDMIGHNDANSINAVATRSSQELHRIHQEANQHVGMKLVHPEDFRIGRSDHGRFFNVGVPVMYLFGGFHPEYNTPEDTVEKLKPQKLVRVARLAFHTAYIVVEEEKRPSFEWGSGN